MYCVVSRGIGCGREGGWRTLKGYMSWQMCRRSRPRQSILSITTSRLHHLVESKDAIAWLELRNMLADFVNNA